MSAPTTATIQTRSLRRTVTRRRFAAVKLPSIVWWLMGVLALLALLSPNPGIGLFGVAIATGVSVLLWRSGEPQVLLFIVGYQWLQGFAPVLLALYKGESIAKMMGGEEFETATLLTQIGIGVFALGLNTVTSRRVSTDLRRVMDGLHAINRRRLFLAWIVLSAIGAALAIVGYVLPALRQGFIVFDVLKWTVVLLLFLRWLVSGQGLRDAVLVVVVEISLGMLTYFSAFKEVFFILLLAGTGIFALGRKSFGILIAMVAALMVILTFWQSIKTSYRQYLSQGERAQVVRVSVPARIAWLVGAIFETKQENLSEGFEDGLRRLGYVEFFGHSLRTVPKMIPHTHGKLWKEAVLHPLMPRLFFPNKAVINDSDRTNAYTGVLVAGADTGTSISIGYMGESYIDFGRWGMMPAIFLWGCLVGWCYKFLLRKAPHPLLGMCLASSLLLSTVLLLESSNIKLTGSLIAGFLGTYVLTHSFGRAAWLWLISGSGSAAGRSTPAKRARRHPPVNP
jgi:hypothetical protein